MPAASPDIGLTGVVVRIASCLTPRRRAPCLAVLVLLVGGVGPRPAAADTIRIATFNVAGLASGSRSPQDLRLLARVVAGFDLVALQGVHDEAGLGQLLTALEGQGHGFQGLPRPVPPGEAATELAFVWRTAAVALTDSGGTYPDSEAAFRHDPHYAAFRSGAFDVALVNLSVPADGPVPDRAVEAARGLAARTWVTDELVGEHDVLLLGSLGVEPLDLIRFAGVRSSQLPLLVTRVGDPAPSTRVDSMATVDNLWPCCGSEATGAVGVEAFDEALFAGDAAAAMAAVSDHRPVWAAFSTAGPDDDNLPLAPPVPEVPAWPAVEVRGASQPQDVALADLDGDGRPELLVVDAAAPSFTVHDNGAVQGFGPGAEYPLPGAPGKVAVADLDGDGDLDALVTVPRDSGIVVWRNDAGTLAQAGAFDTRAGTAPFALGDLDGRPGAELARLDVDAERTSLRLSLFRFAPDLGPALWQEVELGADPVASGAVWAGDLDGDGDGDVVLVHPESERFRPAVGYELITARGAVGGTSWTVTRYPVRGGPRDHLFVGDVSGDGVRDAIVARDLTAWVATAPGVFAGPHAETAGHNTGDLCAADFDGDTRQDVALADWRGRVGVFASDGQGGFSDLVDLPFGDRLTRPRVACGDVDGDGDADIVAADATGGRIAVFHNPAALPSGTTPWANAGEGGWVLGGSEVRLDGRRSGDADGDSLAFAWRQVAGPTVELRNASTPVASLTAPQALASLAFALRVSDGQHLSPPDTVFLRVRPTEYPVRLEGPPQATWEAVLHTRAPVSAIAVSPADPRRVYAGTYGHGVFRSVDGGDTWSRSVAGIDTLEEFGRDVPVHQYVQSLAAHPDQEGTAFLGTVGLAYRTVDGGASWAVIAAGGVNVMAVARDSLWVGMGEGAGIQVSDDLGESFVALNNNLPTNDYGAAAAVFGVAVDPFDARVVYAAVAPWGISLYRTLNGRLWNPVEAPGVLPIATSPLTGWLFLGEARNYPMARSRDLGSTWEGLRQGLDGVGQVDDFAFDPGEPLVLYVSTDRGVYWSGDGGTAWRRLDGQPRPGTAARHELSGYVCARPLVLATGQRQHLFVGADSTLYRATLTPAGGTAVTGGPAAQVGLAPRFLNRFPNPTNSGVVLEFDTAGRGRAVLTVHDLLGQVVWRHEAPAAAAGPQRVVWHGRAGDGQAAASGVYFVTLECGGAVDRMRLMLVR